MTPEPILLIEAPSPAPSAHEAILRSAGHPVLRAADGTAGLLRLRNERPAAVLLDLDLPGSDGLGLLAEILSLRPGLPVIGLSEDGTIDRAVAAIRFGAFDFLVRPCDGQRLLQVVGNAIARGVAALRQDAPSPDGPGGRFIGISPGMQQVYRRIESVARSMATVFITGESGTGKELCARAIHEGSARAGRPFVPLDCGAIAADLLDCEVFGQPGGGSAGTGPEKAGAERVGTAKVGAVAAADGGTLFLDEVCALDPVLQTRLLRFLEGAANQPRPLDLRIICATNRDPQEAVRSGAFREDLFYRLHVVPIHMPPLRTRGADILAIAEEALRHYALEEGRSFRALSDEAKEALLAQAWPGNVRQLLNVLRHVVVLNDGAEVMLDMLPDELRHPPEAPAPRAADAPEMSSLLGALDGRPLAEIERLVIEHALDRNGGSVPRAARSLEVAPSTLYRKIEAWRRA